MQKEKLYIPGAQKLGPPNIVNFDPTVQEQFDGIQNRRRELAARRVDVKREIEQTQLNIGALVVEGCSVDEFTAKLVQLRNEYDALQFGIDLLDNQVTVLKRSHLWLS